jgi:hypothetical protein
MRKIYQSELSEFVDYCWGFYGTGEVYDLGASRSALRAACRLVTHRKDIPFEGDTSDREYVRQILESIGYEEKEEAA